MITFLRNLRNQNVGIRVALTTAQWEEVAQRSASDYHDWIDAAEEARWIDETRKATFVDAGSAVCLVELFGERVLA